jgi:hypothetical protein
VRSLRRKKTRSSGTSHTLGVISFVAFCIGVLTFVASVASLIHSFSHGEMPDFLGLAGLSILIWVCIIGGFVIGVVALAMRGSRKGWAVAGTVLNGLLLLVMVCSVLSQHRH